VLDKAAVDVAIQSDAHVVPGVVVRATEVEYIHTRGAGGHDRSPLFCCLRSSAGVASWIVACQFGRPGCGV